MISSGLNDLMAAEHRAVVREGGCIYFRQGPRQVRLAQREIYYVESARDDLIVRLRYERYTIHCTMKHFVECLSAKDFVQVHRSFLVRLDRIASISAAGLTMDNMAQKIPIGELYHDGLMRRLVRF